MRSLLNKSISRKPTFNFLQFIPLVDISELLLNIKRFHYAFFFFFLSPVSFDLSVWVFLLPCGDQSWLQSSWPMSQPVEASIYSGFSLTSFLSCKVKKQPTTHAFGLINKLSLCFNLRWSLEDGFTLFSHLLLTVNFTTMLPCQWVFKYLLVSEQTNTVWNSRGDHRSICLISRIAALCVCVCMCKTNEGRVCLLMCLSVIALHVNFTAMWQIQTSSEQTLCQNPM